MPYVLMVLSPSPLAFCRNKSKSRYCSLSLYISSSLSSNFLRSASISASLEPSLYKPSVWAPANSVTLIGGISGSWKRLRRPNYIFASRPFWLLRSFMRLFMLSSPSPFRSPWPIWWTVGSMTFSKVLCLSTGTIMTGLLSKVAFTRSAVTS